MYTELEYMQKWMTEVATEYNLPIEVVERIYQSQNDFIRTKIQDKNETTNLHIGGLGKFYTYRDRTKAPHVRRSEEKTN